MSVVKQDVQIISYRTHKNYYDINVIYHINDWTSDFY